MTDLLPDLRANLSTCTRCDLRANARAPVPFRGPLNPRVAVLGMAPGKTEDAWGMPFVGRAGKMLTGLLTEASIDPDSVAYVNAVRCLPPGNNVLPHHLAACRPWLRTELAFINPTYLIVCGDVAMRSITGESKWAKLAYLHGRPLFWPDPPIPARPKLFITYHPSWALRSQANRDALARDLETFNTWVDAGENWPVDCAICHGDFYDWDEEGWGVALCERHQWRGKQRRGHLRDLQQAGGRDETALVLSRRSRVGRSEDQWWDQRVEV